MTNDVVFRTIFLILLLGFIAIRAYYALKLKPTVKTMVTKWEGKRTMIFRTVLGILMLLFLLLYISSPQLLTWSFLPLPTWLSWVGVALNSIALGMLFLVHATLGKNWSANVTIREGHTMTTTGFYHWIRHPMYTVFIIWGLALFLLTTSWCLGILFIAFICWLVVRAGKEETMMVEQFGDQYQMYRKHTGKFLPHLRKTGPGLKPY